MGFLPVRIVIISLLLFLIFERVTDNYYAPERESTEDLISHFSELLMLCVSDSKT